MSTAYSFSGSLLYPPDSGQPSATRAFSNSGSFDSKVEYELVLTGAGTKVVDFGSIAKAKAILVEVASSSLAPVKVKLSGGTDQHEIAPGGFLSFGSPTPVVGITGLSIVHTDDAKVGVYILG